MKSPSLRFDQSVQRVITLTGRGARTGERATRPAGIACAFAKVPSGCFDSTNVECRLSEFLVQCKHIILFPSG